MNELTYALRAISDTDLLERLTEKNREHRLLLSDLLLLLAEVDRRKLYLGQGFSSLFAFALARLHFSEDEAGKRIQACRTAQRYPKVLELVAQGELHLTAVNLLSPHLTEGNHLAVLEAARRKCKRELEELVASLNPQPDAVERLRREPDPRPAPRQLGLAPSAAAAAPSSVPGPAASAPALPPSTPAPAPSPSPGAVAPAAPPAAPPPRGSMAPLSPGRYRLQVTLGREGRDALLRVKELLAREDPKGELGGLVEKALLAYVEELERRKFGKLRRGREDKPAAVTTSSEPAVLVPHAPEHVPEPKAAAPVTPAAQAEPQPQPDTSRSEVSKPRSRYIPRAIRRAVFERDGGQCTFVGPHGRCCEKRRLELHHLEPFARGGEHSVDALAVRCSSHNRHEAELDFGADHVRAAILAKQQQQQRLRLEGSAEATER